LNDSALNGFSNLLITQRTQRTRKAVKTSFVCVLCAVFPSHVSVSEHYIPLTQASRELRLIAVDYFENLLKGLKGHVQGTPRTCRAPPKSSQSSNRTLNELSRLRCPMRSTDRIGLLFYSPRSHTVADQAAFVSSTESDSLSSDCP
jgi:hypothetical protein